MAFRISRGIWQFQKADGTYESKYKLATDGRLVQTDALGNEVSTFGSTASWDTVTGKPSTFTPSAHTHDDRYYTETEVNTLLAGKQAAGSYAAASHTHTIANVTGLQAALDGKQASGSYLTSLGFSYSTGVTANHVVQRDVNGYIYANHINFSTTETENPTINSFITSNGDGWSRKSSLAHVRNQLGNYGGWITTNGRAYPRRADGPNINFYWDGQGGQPTWLWGSNNGTDFYVWNPSNFSVNYANTSGSAGQVSGVSFSASEANALKTTLGVTGLPYSVDIVVNGDANTYYPVHFIWGDQDVWRRIIIKRGYGEQAPWDPINTGVHHGGLLLDWEGNFGGWGGADYSDRLRVFQESYTTICADMYRTTHSMGYTFFLRGGGAIYHIYSDQAIRGYQNSSAPDIAYDTNYKFYDGGENPQYTVYAPAPLTSQNGDRIDGLRTKKQSQLDSRYQQSATAINTGNIGSQSVNYASSAGAVAWSSVSGKPSTFTPSSHTHAISEVTGLQSALDGKQAAGSYAAASHTHTIANVTGQQAALDGKQVAGSYAAASHTHTIANVTGLQTALDGKQAAGSYAAASHTHTIANVTGLQSALDGKQASGSYLTTSGKAADSELIDGIDSSRIIYGDGGFGSTSYSDMNNTAQKSGFFFYNNPTGSPFGDWTHWINSMGNSWNPNYGFQLAHAFHSDRLAVRVVANGGWGSWRTIIDSGNIGSQSVNYANTAGSAPANGGNSTTVAGLAVHAGRNHEANKIVRTQANGYVDFGWINTTSGDNGTTAISRIYASQDGYIRYYTPANFISVLGLITSSNWTSYITVPPSLVTGNTSAASLNTTSFNIYNDNFTESPVVLQMNGRQVILYDRMNYTCTFSGRGVSSYQMDITEMGINFKNEYGGWAPIACEYVEQVSDINLKHYVSTIQSPIEKVKQLRGVDFFWKRNNQPSIGFIAQEVEEVLPVVVGNIGGTKTIDYSKIVPILTEAIKAQQTIIEQLMARLDALESK